MAGPINFHPEQNLRPLDCGQCEALFAEVLDQADGRGPMLDPAELARFNAHVEGCGPCAGLLDEARRGHDWLRMLHQEPVVPPADLFARILAGTSGAQNASSVQAPAQPIEKSLVAAAGHPAIGVIAPSVSVVARRSKPWDRVNLVAMARSGRRNLTEPRFLLTAAMAFFSITLTFNLLGIHVTQVRPADLKPSNLRRSISRSFTETNARVTRYYDNLRIVYELEARVREFRRNADENPEGGTRKQPAAKPAGGGGPSSQRDTNDGNRTDRVAGDKQTASPKRDETEPATAGDSDLREVALRHPRAWQNNSNENLRLRASYQRRLV
jgi:hypothetical protein